MPSEIVPQSFTSEDFGTISVFTDNNGEQWFVAKEVCDVLGIDTNHVKESLDEDEVSNLRITEVGPKQGGRAPLVITEAGFYKLVMKSRKPNAKAFQRWVTHDVLPTIRKHGMYATPQTVQQMLSDPDTMIQTLEALKAERKRADALMEDNQRMLPKAVIYDTMIEAGGTMSLTKAARYLSQYDRRLNRKRLVGLLRADGLLCKQDMSPTKKAIDRGYMVQMIANDHDGKPVPPYAHLTRKGLDWCRAHYCQEVSGDAVA